MGFSPQRTEDEESFRRAINDLVPAACRKQVKFLYSDSPAKYMEKLFPNLVGVAEDFLHLVFRVEYCFGGKRNKMTREILELQRKLLNPPNGNENALYYGSPLKSGPKQKVRRAREVTKSKWAQYIKRPFTSYAEYVSQLERIQHKYPKEMGRRDGAGKRGRTVAAILRTGASERHYRYLFNNSIFASMGSKATGTMVTEAMHKQIKAWGATVTQQHADRMATVGKVFGLYKLLGRKRQATKVPENKILALVAGRIVPGGIGALCPSQQCSPAATKPSHYLDARRRLPKLARKDEQKLRAGRR